MANTLHNLGGPLSTTKDLLHPFLGSSGRLVGILDLFLLIEQVVECIREVTSRREAPPLALGS